MTSRNKFFLIPTLAAAFSATTLQPVHAQDQPATPPPAAGPQDAPPPPAGGPPREGGGRGEGGPRGEGDRGGGGTFGAFGGRGEGGQGGARGEGGRGEGGFGGGRGEGGGRGGMGGGAPANETPEQRQARMERVIAPYLEILPDLSEDQKTQILAIVDASSSEVRALRANQSMAPERKAQQLQRLRSFLPQHISIALTDEQTKIYVAAVADQAEAAAAMQQVGSVRPDEGVEEMRARLLTGYEPVLEELSVKQKTAIIKILEAAGEESAAVNADTKLNADQKKIALRKIHDDASAKVLPLLDAEQKDTWKKAHAAKRP